MPLVIISCSFGELFPHHPHTHSFTSLSLGERFVTIHLQSVTGWGQGLCPSLVSPGSCVGLPGEI